MWVSSPIWRWKLSFSAAGALALGVQTYLLREFLVLLQGDEVAVGLGLAAWLVGIAGGAGMTRRCPEGSARSVAAAALALLGLLGCAEMFVARIGRSLVLDSPGALLSLGPSLLLAIGLFVVPGACVGTAFVALALATRATLGGSNRAIGRLYVFEAIGSLVAGLVTSLVLVPSLTPTVGLSLLMTGALLCAMPAFRLVSAAPSLLLWVATLVGFGLALSPLGAWLEQKTEQARFVSMATGSPWVASKYTPYQHLAIGGAEQRVLYANGQYLASYPDPTADELLAHQLMLLAKRPRRMASFGGLETGLLRFCLTHPIEAIDLVLLDSVGFHFVERTLDPVDRAALADPRVRLVFADPRSFLGRSGPAYDLVLSLDPDPTTLWLARTSSVEFDRLVRSRLTSDGVYVVRFSAGANLQSGELGLLGATLFRSLSDVFPVVRATPGPEAFFVSGSSREHLTLDAAVLERRYHERQVRSEVFTPDLLSELLPAERVAAINRELQRSSRSVRSAHDDRPIAFLHALQVRQRIAGSAWAKLLGWSAFHSGWLAWIALAPSLLLLLLRFLSRRPQTMHVAVWHATAVTGGCGLGASLLVFVSFQTRVGSLYSELGALSALFMVGLAAGGVVAQRGSNAHPLLGAQAVCLGLAVVLCGSLGLLDRTAPMRLLLWPLHLLLLGSAGFGTGMVFPSATRELVSNVGDDTRDPAGPVAASLEFWDHIGAALVALFGAVLLIPTLGLVRCAGLFVALHAVAMVTTWSMSAKPKFQGSPGHSPDISPP
jgi:predicted membrane-bound spermidine synthase